MTEHRLDAAQIGAVLEEVRGETVAQFVRRGRLPNSGHARVQKDAFPESLTSQRLARWGEEEHTARCGPRVLRAVDDDQLEEETLKLARAIAENTPLGTQLTKRSLWLNQDIGSLEAAIEMESRAVFMAQSTEDAAEKRRAVKEKRPPRFTGR